MPTVHRIYNFSAGPAVLPLPVLEEIQRDLLALPGVGMSILEISHRSRAFESILAQAEADIRALAGIPPNYQVLFLQGGASLQFSMVPMNLLAAGATADYIDTGSWAEKAIEEAKKGRHASNVAASTQGRELHPHSRRQSELKLTRGRRVRPHDLEQHDRGHRVQAAARRRRRRRSSATHRRTCSAGRSTSAGTRSIYAGAQKNMGPAGVTVVIIRDDLLRARREKKSSLPTMLNYAVHAENRSLYNTPPVFAVYALGLVMKWLLAQGGLAAIGAVNERKAAQAVRRDRPDRLLSRDGAQGRTAR